MNYPGAIVIAATLIAGAIALNTPSEARHMGHDGHSHFQIVSDGAGHVWHMHDDQLRRCKVEEPTAAKEANCSE